jgi:RHS repeat-associated protein
MMRLKIIVYVGLLCALALSSAHAQSTRVAFEYPKKIDAAKRISPLTATAFGNATDDSTGRTIFSALDVDLPGNSGLPVSFGRRLAIDYRFLDQELNGLGNWDVEVPYIEGTFSKLYGWTVGNATASYRYNRCSHPDAPAIEGGSFTASEVWHGYNIHVPGVLDDALAIDSTAYADPTDGKAYPWILKSMARLGCLPSLKSGQGGEGFILLTQDGTRYYFDYMVERKASTLRKGAKGCDGSGCAGLSIPRKRLFLLATRIEDRFGNFVNYQYDTSGRPLSITANDGRTITAAYTTSSITVSAHGQTWLYTLQNGQLVSVRNPDNFEWKCIPYGQPTQILNFEESPGTAPLPGETFNPDNDCLYAQPNLYTTPNYFEVTHPSGAKAKFDFDGRAFYRSHVIYMCNILYTSPDGSQGAASVVTPNYFGVYSLAKISVSGPGVGTENTLYEYSHEFYPYCDQLYSATGEYFGPRCNEDQCAYGDCTDAVGRWVTVTKPDNTKTRKRFGVIYGENEGRLLAEEVLDAQGLVIRRIDYQYLPDQISGNQVFGSYIGIPLSSDPMHGKVRPLVSTQITQGGVTFKSEVPVCNGAAYCFDAFARPIKTKRSNTLGFVRTDVAEYHDNPNRWVLNQPKRGYNIETGVVEYETSYNGQALPEWTKKYEKLQQTITYNADGTVATVADGRGNTITLSNWKRGTPQHIQHPITPEAPTGATESAVVNDSGWITSVTNEIGVKTCYGYDAMGRLASILYPSETQLGVCDTSRWSPASLSFVPVNYDEHGLPAGHWRASRYEGNKHVNTYYDAMWRPVLEEALDASNIAGTLSQVVKKYDAGGRLSFQSYPTSNVGNYWDVTQGTRSFYDALDRVTRVEQDSEQDVLVTTTDYWPNLQIRVVNPRNQATVTAFMAWDQPRYDLPIASVQPEGKVIEIARHPQFGWPLQLKQRNAGNTLQQIRKYVYDDNAQLCKTIEPETGATVTGYDAASNPAWSASGLTGGDYASTAECSYVAANASGRVVNRTYDNRNRLKTLLFPDGRGNQVWNYEPDGQPKDITTFNDPNNTTPVVNGYAYNKRRMLINEYSHQPGWYTWGLGYEYDSIGNLRWQSYPTGLTVDYAPNALGQSTGVRDQNNKFYASGASYYPNGALKQFTYGNGIVHSMTQNARQLPSRVSSSGGVSDFGYSYDQNANVSHIWDYARDNGNGLYGRWMTYDGLDRLTSAGSCNFGGDCWHRFSYDALDNIKSWKLGGVKDYADYVYEAGTNRLTSIRNTAGATVMGIDYDPQGNLRNKNGQAYDFDYGNRLRGVTLKEYYRYDGLGRRVLNWRYPTASTPNGAVLVSQYSQSGQLMYQEGSPEGASEHIYLAGSLIATRNNGASKYQHTDALGSPVAVTNEVGTVIERNDYEPYGAVIGQPNKNGIGYTGHMMDGATGLTYMQQRYYDQSLGRFLSVDPVTANSANGTNFNRYKYAENNPYKFVDPDGRQSLETLGPSSTVTTGSPFLDSLLKPSDVQAMGKGQMMREQLVSEASQSRSWKDVVLYVAIAMSAGTGASGRSPLVGAAAAEAKPASAFFSESRYGARVLGQMKQGDAHAFPLSVDTFAARDGIVRTVPDSRGAPVQMLTLRGEYKGRTGTFEYIKNKSNEIYHRLFRPEKLK